MDMATDSTDPRSKSLLPNEQSGGVTENVGFGDYFFIRRRPKLRTLREYKRPDINKPEEAKAYAERLKRSGFIRLEDIVAYNQLLGKPEGSLKRLRNDVQFMLETPVSELADASYVDRLFQFDTDAIFYQNSYYWYNWIFIVGAFITTIVSVIGVVSTRFDPTGMLAGVAWGVTTLFGLITAVATALNQSRRPQLRWYVNRRKAEAMRRHYYLYITRAEPYSGSPEARRTKLKEVIRQIENIGSSLNTDEAQRAAVVTPEVAPVPIEQRLQADELEFLAHMYRERRLQAQTTWYRNRKQEFEHNSNFALLLSALFVSAGGIVGGLSAQYTDSLFVQLLPTALPALAAALAAFHQVYGWDRQRRVYDDTIAQLRGASDTYYEGEGAVLKQNFLDSVKSCEDVFAAESDQWGQGLIDAELASFNAQTSDSQFMSIVRQSKLTSDKQDEIIAIWRSMGGGVSSDGTNAPTPIPNN
jgi:hypothetical protein